VSAGREDVEGVYTHCGVCCGGGGSIALYWKCVCVNMRSID
jgi:hypothetical protein